MRVKDPTALRRWRQRRRLSQRDLAHLARCTQATISLLEVGNLPTISEELAYKLADRLDVPWEDLFEVRESARLRRVTNGTPVVGQVAVA